MTSVAYPAVDRAVSAAETVLAARSGAGVSLLEPEDLGGSGRTTVVRVKVGTNPFGMARSMVVKQLGDAADDLGGFDRELASYRFVNTLPSQSRPGPQLIAADPAQRLLILSDLGDGRSMPDLLASTSRQNLTHAVSAWGQALGRMHAATVGGEDDFAALLRHGQAHDSESSLHTHARAVVKSAPTSMAELLGEPLPEAVLNLWERADRMFTDAEYRAFSPSDVGAENILLNADGVQFLDYEWGGFRDAFLDVGYVLSTFARFVDRTVIAEEEIVSTVERALVDAWSAEVAPIWPSAGRRRFQISQLLAARMSWVWLSSVWLLPQRFTPAAASQTPIAEGVHMLALHTNSLRVVIERWAQLAHVARVTGQLELEQTADAMRRRLGRIACEI